MIYDCRRCSVQQHAESQKISFFNIQVPSKFANFRLLLLHLFPGLL